MSEELQREKWVVYAKAPFGGPQHVLEYLGRYTHRAAISNRRLLSLQDGQVSFQWKDYRDANRVKVMTLSADEFSLKTGIHAKSLILPSENLADPEQLVDEYYQRHHADSPEARLFVDELIHARIPPP